MSTQLQRVLVWPGLLRGLHWGMALCALVLMLTGWLLGSGLLVNPDLRDLLLDVWHVPAGHVLAGLLLVRLGLLFTQRGVSGWRALLPNRLQPVMEVLQFYTAFARLNLKTYFAHNPFWAPLYLLMFVLLLVQSVSGLLLVHAGLRSLVTGNAAALLDLHQWLLTPLAVLLIAHLVTVFLHDWKTSTGEVSAMINGHKHFEFERGPGAKAGDSGEVSVSVADMLAGIKSSKGKAS